MVAARTRHLDHQIRDFVAAGGRNLVLLGVGWDMRPFRLRLPPGTTIYELDFPTTLAERRRRLEQLGIDAPPGTTRVEVPIDVRTMSLAATLEDYVDPASPLFVAWEGMSMYLEDDEVSAILRGMQPLLTCPQSRLWVDLVDRTAITHPEFFPREVRAFMRGMQILGEPFTFGTEDVERFMAEHGFRCHDVVCSNVFLEDKSDPVYSLYRFCVASEAAGLPRGNGARRGLRVDLPTRKTSDRNHRSLKSPGPELPEHLDPPDRA
jgi:methyltransferase (TIGR00027 family)